MTAEVLAMNRLAVAMATDSAVTIGDKKIYTSVDKLFQLFESVPIGIMIYGNADFVGVPWETIIKLYRSKHGKTAFKTVSESADHFIDFLGKQTTLFPEEMQIRFVREFAVDCFLYLRAKLEEELFPIGRVIEQTHINNAFKTVINEKEKILKNYHKFQTHSKEINKALTKSQINEIIETRENVFARYIRTNTINNYLKNIVKEGLFKLVETSNIGSGLVFAGFGDKQTYPSMVEIRVQGMISNSLLFLKVQSHEVGRESGAWVIPFAQQDMVSEFLTGIHPFLKMVIEVSFEKLINEIPNRIYQDIKKVDPSLSTKLSKKYKPITRTLFNDTKAGWESFRWNRYIRPVMEILQHLPKDELAAMAESLVHLTKFKKRVSYELETVGGPIDVAVITKGDGFVWIKRKHYYKPELNPRLIAKYFCKDKD